MDTLIAVVLVLALIGLPLLLQMLRHGEVRLNCVK